MTEKKCSRAGCESQAVKLIQWRNPKIHSSDRVKVWAACDEHLGFLVDYLQARNFFLGVTDFAANGD